MALKMGTPKSIIPKYADTITVNKGKEVPFSRNLRKARNAIPKISPTTVAVSLRPCETARTLRTAPLLPGKIAMNDEIAQLTSSVPRII
jgi:hypothetical protein